MLVLTGMNYANKETVQGGQTSLKNSKEILQRERLAQAWAFNWNQHFLLRTKRHY